MDDLIRRKDAIKAIEDLQDCYNGFSDTYDKACIIGVLEELPSAQRKGKWIATKEWGGRNYSCSCCKFSFIVDTCMLEPMWNFCPNCGAEMKGEQDVE